MSKRKTVNKAKLPSIIVTELFLGVTAGIISFFIFLKLALSIPTLQSFDTNTSILLISLRTPFLTSVMGTFTLLGNQALLVLLVIVALILILKRHGRDALIFVLIVGVGIVLNLVLKEVIARARPDISPLIHEEFYSFPSGHAMNSFVFYGSVALYAYRHIKRRTVSLTVIVLCGMIVTMIGISRVYLGVHYPTDVIAGLIAGFWWVVTALIIEKSLYLYSHYFQRAA
jgi:undecaprenyl-diphosphatase